MLKVRYRGMWAGFNSQGSGLPDLIRRVAGGGVVVVDSAKERVDLEVCSVFPSRTAAAVRLGKALVRRALDPEADYRGAAGLVEPSGTAQTSVWFTGENLRPPPPSAGWDLTLSFEADTWTKNAYLPLWLLGTDAFGGRSTGHLGRPLRLDELTTGREDPEFSHRSKFCCAFIRNPEPTRLAAIDALRQIGEVDVFGPITGRMVASKHEVARNYRFMLCMENDLYPGYVTEKPIEAWASGCIPLWWGLDRDRTLNSGSLVNLADFPGLEAFVERVSTVNADEALLESMWRERLVQSPPDVARLVDRVKQLLIS